MSTSADMAERHSRMLADLAERGYALACRIQEDAMAAEAPEARAELGRAFHQISRSVRQTVALEARLERDRVREQREGRERAAGETEARVQRRKARVKATVERLVWTEIEGEDAERLIDALDDLVNEDSLAGGFLADPVEAYVEKLRYDLGLDLGPDGLPRPARDGEGEPRGLGLFNRVRRHNRHRDLSFMRAVLPRHMFPQAADEDDGTGGPDDDLEFDAGPDPPDDGLRSSA